MPTNESSPTLMGPELFTSATENLLFPPNDTDHHCKTHMPSVVDFAHSITIELMALILVAACVTFATIFIFWRQFAAIKKRTPKQFMAHTVILCGMYQVR